MDNEFKYVYARQSKEPVNFKVGEVLKRVKSCSSGKGLHLFKNKDGLSQYIYSKYIDLIESNEPIFYLKRECTKEHFLDYFKDYIKNSTKEFKHFSEVLSERYFKYGICGHGFERELQKILEEHNNNKITLNRKGLVEFLEKNCGDYLFARELLRDIKGGIFDEEMEMPW